MGYLFDLWSYDDVVEEASSVLARLEDGTMPCDSPWDAAAIETFREWMNGGYRP